MDHVSSGAVGAIVKQIKDLQKNPAEGITVRLLFFCAGEALTRKDALFLLDAKERERERLCLMSLSRYPSLMLCFVQLCFFRSPCARTTLCSYFFDNTNR